MLSDKFSKKENEKLQHILSIWIDDLKQKHFLNNIKDDTPKIIV